MTDTTFTVLDNGYCRVDWLEAEAALTVLSPEAAMAWTGHIGSEVLEAVRTKFSQEPEEVLTSQVFIIFITEVHEYEYLNMIKVRKYL